MTLVVVYQADKLALPLYAAPAHVQIRDDDPDKKRPFVNESFDYKDTRLSMWLSCYIVRKLTVKLQTGPAGKLQVQLDMCYWDWQNRLSSCKLLCAK